MTNAFNVLLHNLQGCLSVQLQSFRRNRAGSLAKFTASRRASSLVSSFAAVRHS
jgi:hypothetical protein